MRFIEFIKRHSTVIIVVAAVLYAIAVSAAVFIWFILSIPHGNNDRDIFLGDAIEIVKKDFDCDKILWADNCYDTGLIKESKEEIDRKTSGSRSVFYVLGEKAGNETLVVVPSNLENNKPFVATWALDHSFKQVVEVFNAYGAEYVADVSMGYIGSRGIHVCEGRALNNMWSHFEENTGTDTQTFYNRLDVKAAFYYQWMKDDIYIFSVVTQENGELEFYELESAQAIA